MTTKNYKVVTPAEAVKVIKSGDHVHLSSVASSPQCLINAMCARGDAGELKDVHIHHLHTEGPAPYTEAKYEGVFQHDAFFVGANVRKSVQAGFADYIPIFLSETQRLYRDGYIKCNVAMIQVCPPDEHGYVSLGTSVDATLAAVETADHVIAVVNKNVPRAFGQAMIPMSLIDIFVEDDTPLEPAHFSEPSEVEKLIGLHCAELIEDGAACKWVSVLFLTLFWLNWVITKILVFIPKCLLMAFFLWLKAVLSTALTKVSIKVKWFQPS